MKVFHPHAPQALRATSLARSELASRSARDNARLRPLPKHDIPSPRRPAKTMSAAWALHGTKRNIAGAASAVLLGLTLGLASPPAHGAAKNCNGALGNVTFIPFLGDLADATSDPCYPTVTLNPTGGAKSAGKGAVKKAAASQGASKAKKVATFAGTNLAELKSPSARHSYARIGKKTVAKRNNTVAEPGVSLANDTAAIRAGGGKIAGEEITVNGRVYKAHSGRLYPVRGEGLHSLNRGAFKALQKYKELGNTQQARDIMAKMGISDADRRAAKNLFDLGQ